MAEERTPGNRGWQGKARHIGTGGFATHHHQEQVRHPGFFIRSLIEQTVKGLPQARRESAASELRTAFANALLPRIEEGRRQEVFADILAERGYLTIHPDQVENLVKIRVPGTQRNIMPEPVAIALRDACDRFNASQRSQGEPTRRVGQGGPQAREAAQRAELFIEELDQQRAGEVSPSIPLGTAPEAVQPVARPASSLAPSFQAPDFDAVRATAASGKMEVAGPEDTISGHKGRERASGADQEEGISAVSQEGSEAGRHLQALMDAAIRIRTAKEGTAISERQIRGDVTNALGVGKVSVLDALIDGTLEPEQVLQIKHVRGAGAHVVHANSLLSHALGISRRQAAGVIDEFHAEARERQGRTQELGAGGEAQNIAADVRRAVTNPADTGTAGEQQGPSGGHRSRSGPRNTR